MQLFRRRLMPHQLCCWQATLPVACLLQLHSRLHSACIMHLLLSQLSHELSSLLGHAAPARCLQVSKLGFKLGSLLGLKTHTACLQFRGLSHTVHACKSMSSAKPRILPDHTAQAACL